MTTGHERSSATVSPPSRPCATTPPASTSAGRSRSRRSGRTRNASTPAAMHAIPTTRREQPVAVLDPHVRGQLRQERPRAVRPARAAEAGAREPHAGAAEHDQHERRRARRRRPSDRRAARASGDPPSGPTCWQRARRADPPGTDGRAAPRRARRTGSRRRGSPRRVDDADQRDHAAEHDQPAADAEAGAVGRHRRVDDRGRARRTAGRRPRRPAATLEHARPRPRRRTAIASSAATREIWLLTPLATPALCCGTAPSTVFVSGATVADRPSAEHEHAGQQVGPRSPRRRAAGPSRSARSPRRSARSPSAAAARSGPTARPNRRESSHMHERDRHQRQPGRDRG